MSNTKQNRTVHTSITYDHDREPLEAFLKAAGFNVVTIDVDDKQSLSQAIGSSPEGFAVVSSLVNSRRVNLGEAFNVLLKADSGIMPTNSELKAAGLFPLDEGHFGDDLAKNLARQPVPSLTVIFSSESPSYKGKDVKFVSKNGLFSSSGRDRIYSEIKGHLDKFFGGLDNNK